MIAFVVAMGLAAAAGPMPGPPAHERKGYAVCLSKLLQDKLSQTLDGPAYQAAAKTACATEEAAFRKAWISYDVAMKTKPHEAEKNAADQVDETLQNSTESYVNMVKPKA